jgi:hypothetical protein
MHFQNNSIKRITERNTITRYTTFYPGKPLRGTKPNKNFLDNWGPIIIGESILRLLIWRFSRDDEVWLG